MLPILVHTRHFPPRRFHAITLFPFVFYNGKPLSAVDLRHETVHLWQQLALAVVFFYLAYICFWLFGLVRFRDSDRAYRAIPFERSAYALESCPSLSPRAMAFDWIHYLTL